MLSLLLLLISGSLTCPDDPLCRACSVYIGGFCAQCFDSVILPTGQCDSSVKPISHCDRHESIDGKIYCAQCDPGFFLSPEKECHECRTKNCAFCLAPGDWCLACFNGILAMDGGCKGDMGPDKNCAIPLDKDHCWLCNDDFAVGVDGVCQKATKECMTLNKAGVCVGCRDGSYITKDNTCLVSGGSGKWLLRIVIALAVLVLIALLFYMITYKREEAYEKN